MTSSNPADRNPAIAELLEDAFISPVDVETAARHLWAIHHESKLIAAEREVADLHLDLADLEDPEPVSLATGRFPRALAPLVALIMLMSMSGVAMAASRGSLPGDALYGLKRGQETAQLVFTWDPAQRVELQISFAEIRLAEIRAVGPSRPDVVPDLVAEIADTLSEVEQAVADGGPTPSPAIAAGAERLRQQTSQEVAGLRLPSEIDQAVGQALATTGGDEVAAGEVDPAASAMPTSAATASVAPALPVTEDKAPVAEEQVATTATVNPTTESASVPAESTPPRAEAPTASQPPATTGTAATVEPTPQQETVGPPDIVTGPAPPTAPAVTPPNAPAVTTTSPTPTPTPSPSPSASPTPPVTTVPTPSTPPTVPPTATTDVPDPFDNLSPSATPTNTLPRPPAQTH